MRVYPYVLILAGLTACESDLELQAAVVNWMEWPAEVRAATPFKVRLVMPFPACHQWVFKPSVSVDQSAVTFAPYFLVEKGAPVCLPSPAVGETSPVAYSALDTVSTAPGLAATTPRTYEMRATTFIATPGPGTDSTPRTFGAVTVRPAEPDTSQHSAAGVVTLLWDIEGCGYIVPVGQFPVRYVLEDQADTIGLSYAFVRGYIHDAAAPVCGQTRVFHLVTRN